MSQARDWKPGARVETRKFQQGPCLNCQAPLTGITGDGGSPDPGAIMVCAYCSHVMEWDGKKLVALSDETIKDIAGDPDILAVMKLTGQYREEHGPFAFCAACDAENVFGAIRCKECGKPLVFPK